MKLVSKEDDYAAITEEPAADFHDLAAAVLDNEGIDTVAWLCTTRDLADGAAVAPRNPTAALVEANKDEIIYKITFDLPDAGLKPEIIPNIPPIPPVNTNKVDAAGNDPSQSWEPITHCTRSQAPRMSLLQLGEMQMHRSVLDARQYAGMTRKERINATTLSIIHLEPKVG